MTQDVWMTSLFCPRETQHYFRGGRDEREGAYRSGKEGDEPV